MASSTREYFLLTNASFRPVARCGKTIVAGRGGYQNHLAGCNQLDHLRGQLQLMPGSSRCGRAPRPGRRKLGLESIEFASPTRPLFMAAPDADR